jgi:hypothetical protein
MANACGVSANESTLTAMTAQKKARETTLNLLLLGLLALAIGLAIVRIAWPHTVLNDEVDLLGSGPTSKERGSWAAVDAGFVIAGLGQASVFIAMIGYGVRLGVTSAIGASEPDAPRSGSAGGAEGSHVMDLDPGTGW